MLHPSSTVWRGLAVAVLATVVAACASGTPAVTERGARPSGSAGTSSTTSTADPGHPVGVVAVGHSGMTGFHSDPNAPDDDVFANSWATGTNPAVDSIYARLTRAVPETADHVANLARDGAEAALLPYQAHDALRLVPTPRLALVQIMDNDIRCDGTDSAHLAEFRASVREAVDVLVAASPKVSVVLVSGAGRPATYAAAIAALPTTPADLVGTGPCALFKANKTVNTTEVNHLTRLMEAYEAELAKVCTGVPQCHTDAGAATRVVDSLDAYGTDLGHQSVIGHARTAAAVWPEVAKALGLPTG
ncbi:hypothetical protein [Phycicoccus sp. Root101]|uniref:hypothetical protein n=1 Tax=Phycicoccus sp. Root101 TaxID=1736421 RepID=UPI00138EE69A|nr:hypothetical protein [Phycicoccus sp. Root101]